MHECMPNKSIMCVCVCVCVWSEQDQFWDLNDQDHPKNIAARVCHCLSRMHTLIHCLAASLAVSSLSFSRSLALSLARAGALSVSLSLCLFLFLALALFLSLSISLPSQLSAWQGRVCACVHALTFILTNIRRQKRLKRPPRLDPLRPKMRIRRSNVKE